MTGIELVIVTMLILSYALAFVIGASVGAVCMAYYISREMKKRMAQHLLLPPPLEGEEWKKGKEDEEWLKRILGDDKDTK